MTAMTSPLLNSQSKRDESMSQLSKGRAHRANVSLGVALAGLAVVALACGEDDFVQVGVSSISVTPNVLSFNAQGVGVPDTQYLTIANVGRGELVVTAIEMVTQSREFSFEGGAPSFPIRLAQGEERHFPFTYNPEDCRPDRGSLWIRSNDRDVQVALQPQDLTGTVFVNPGIVDFGRVVANQYRTIAVNITNSGTCTLNINDLFISGSGEFHFSQPMGDGWAVTDPMPAEGPITLEPSQTVAVDITYNPINDGFDEGLMYIRSDDAATREKEVPLVANGDQACISVTEEDGIDYGSRFIGETHGRTMTIRNCSQREQLHVTSLELGPHWELDGLERYGLTALPTLPLTLAPQELGTFTLTYSPIQYTPETHPGCTSEGCEVPDGAVLTVLSNDEFKSPLDIPVRGLGTNNHCPVAVARARVQSNTPGPWDTQIDTIPLATLEFDGRNSSDEEGPIASYLWEVVNRPAGSVAIFNPNNEIPNPTFFLDLAGSYVFSLRVYDTHGVESCDPAEVTAIVTPNQHIHVQLVWDTPGDPDPHDTGAGRGTDLDLHFMHPNGTWNAAPWDCYWANRNPNWGGPGDDDDPSLDIDDTDGWGPENINLDNPEGTMANPIEYKVGVFYFSDHGFGPSDATVRIYLDGLERFSSTFPNLRNRQFWDVARIAWPTREITRIHTLYPSGFP
jgi:hypothetical protein